MASERNNLKAGIAAMEAQRGVLPSAVVDSMIASARAQLAALDAAVDPEPAQQLKQVSILFLDVVGSTDLSQHLDPEAISAVMDDALARGTAIVERHRGKVLAYAGDNLLGAFGVDEAREDDAERAVHCGLELLALGKTLASEVLAAHHHAGFDVRIGIHTGGVLLGGGVDAEGTIRGVAVNIAARMEQTAPAGALRISQDTYAQVRGLFEVEAQEPMSVKGIDEPVQSYLVIKAKPRSFRIGTRGIEGVATRMIGREAELEALQAAFKTLFAERKLAAITVTADAGIGKSRLLYEFAAWAEERPERFYIFRGRANPQTQSQPYGLLRDLLAWRFQIGDDDTLEVARRKMEEGMVPLFIDDDGADLAEGHAHVLGHLIGIEWRDSRHVKGILDDPKQIRNRAFHAAAQLLRRIAARDDTPIVLQLEDLHWSDSESLDFLAYLTEIDRDVPILMLAFARPTLFERRVSWCADDIHRRIELMPLDKTGSRQLADEILKKLPEVPAALRELVTGGSEGNPFYMEELVRMLIDQKAIETGEVWKVNAERLLVTHVPPTLTGVLQARLDSLPAAERLTLQEASVIGPVFWDRALFALDAHASAALPSLVTRELALPRADASTDELREYAFKHVILHQVTYATVLKRQRRELHGNLARWLASQTGLRANDFIGIAAEHFEEAGDAANAAEFHTRAAEQAKQRMAHEAVHKHVQRGLALLGRMPDASDDRLRWRLLVAREETLFIQGTRDAQRADIDALEALADKLDEDRSRAYAAVRRAYLASAIADWPLMLAAAERAVRWAHATDDVELQLLAQRMKATALVRQGDLDGGKALAEQVLAEAGKRGLPYVEASCLTTLAVVAEFKGALTASLELCERSLVAARATGNQRLEAQARTNLGAGWLNAGNIDRALPDLEEALRLNRANGDRAMESLALCCLSIIALWQGDDARGRALARTAVDTAVAVRARLVEANALFHLGDAELALGRHDPATEAYRAAYERALNLSHPMQHDASAGLARVALAQGDLGAALEAIGRLPSPDLDQDTGSDPLEGTEMARWIEWTAYLVLHRAGDARANAWLRRAHGALQRQAAALIDPQLRAGFLQNVPHHREIVAAWKARPGVGIDG